MGAVRRGRAAQARDRGRLPGQGRPDRLLRCGRGGHQHAEGDRGQQPDHLGDACDPLDPVAADPALQAAKTVRAGRQDVVGTEVEHVRRRQRRPAPEQQRRRHHDHGADEGSHGIAEYARAEVARHGHIEQEALRYPDDDGGDQGAEGEHHQDDEAVDEPGRAGGDPVVGELQRRGADGVARNELARPPRRR